MISKFNIKPLLLLCIVANSVLAKPQDFYKLPSGPKGPGSFGAYYTKLEYSPNWDKDWRVSDHPDIVVRFNDGGHKFVFWRGTSYIPCWVTENDIWYTNEFVERRGWHSPNTQGCVEPMSDKQCRYSHVRIIENNDARVIVHWRYAPIDVHYEHPFIDEKTGWSDWVDEYYVIYPDATGIRNITAHSTNLEKWIEFHEGIVINQPGTLPHDNIHSDAVSVANMQGEHVTYRWGKYGGPKFDKNPRRANIYKINLKSKRGPFALVEPPRVDGNIITPYLGRNETSNFHWWDHWPVSQDASDGRSAISAKKPSHTSLCHIDIPKLGAFNCFGPFGDDSVIKDGAFEWVTKESAEISLAFYKKVTNSRMFYISFDYANLWTTDISINLYDWKGVTINIDLNDYENELILNQKEFNTFKKKIDLSKYEEYRYFGEFREIGIEVPNTDQKKIIKLDNLKVSNNAPEATRLDRRVDFNLPDGSGAPDIVFEQLPIWQPHSANKNHMTKLMLHGLTKDVVQNLVPYAKSWTNPPTLILENDAFKSNGYDKTELSYAIEASSANDSASLKFTLNGSKDSPIHNPALVVKNWNVKNFDLFINEKKVSRGQDYRYGIEKSLEAEYWVIWHKLESTKPVHFELKPL